MPELSADLTAIRGPSAGTIRLESDFERRRDSPLSIRDPSNNRLVLDPASRATAAGKLCVAPGAGFGIAAWRQPWGGG